MLIKFTCKCGKRLQADDKYAGKHAKCPGCGQMVSIPESKPSAANPDSATVQPDWSKIVRCGKCGKGNPCNVTSCMHCSSSLECTPIPAGIKQEIVQRAEALVAQRGMGRERFESCRYGMRLIDPFGVSGIEPGDCCKNRQAAGRFDRISGFADISSWHDENTELGVAYGLPSASFCASCTSYVLTDELREYGGPISRSEAARTLLSRAQAGDYGFVLESLRKQPNLTNISNENGWTLLHFAAWDSWAMNS